MATPDEAPQFDLTEAEVQQQLPGTLYVLDRSVHVLFWNADAERIYGYSRKEAMGADFRKLTRFEMDGQSETEAWTELVAKGEWNGNAIHHDKHGNRFHVKCKTRFVKDVTGHVVGVACQIRPFSAETF